MFLISSGAVEVALPTKVRLGSGDFWRDGIAERGAREPDVVALGYRGCWR
jgi:hypothetical protein